MNLLGSETPIDKYMEWSERWPDEPFIRHLGICNQELLMLNSLESYKEVFQTHCYSFVKPAFLARLVGEFTGVGLLFTEGDAHKKQRRALTGKFLEADTHLRALYE
jgi:cytochrome P450